MVQQASLRSVEQRPGFDPRSVHVYKVALAYVISSQYFGFHKSVSFHQFPIIIHIFITCAI